MTGSGEEYEDELTSFGQRQEFEERSQVTEPISSNYGSEMLDRVSMGSLRGHNMLIMEEQQTQKPTAFKTERRISHRRQDFGAQAVEAEPVYTEEPDGGQEEVDSRELELIQNFEMTQTVYHEEIRILTRKFALPAKHMPMAPFVEGLPIDRFNSDDCTVDSFHESIRTQSLMSKEVRQSQQLAFEFELACQQKKKVFSDSEVESLRLTRRERSQKVEF